VRDRFPDFVERGRDQTPDFYTARNDKRGRFFVKYEGKRFCIIASDGSDWEVLGLDPPAFEHVSVSMPGRCPKWTEMCEVKDWFWGPEEVVVQYHPPRSQYVNRHPNCLHLWKPIGVEVPLPPSVTVG
jgi:hypothetical protein